MKIETLDDAIAATRTSDVSVVYAGSITQFFLNTRDAIEWVNDNVDTEGWQWMGPTLCVDSRFAHDLATAMIDAGLEVR